MKLGLGLSLPGVATMGGKRTAWARVNSVSSQILATPDAAALDITGDIDIRVRLAADDWTPTTDGSYICGKFTGGSSPPVGRSYAVVLRASGAVRFSWSDGTTQSNVDSSAATGLTDGATKWVRVTLDVDNGAGGHAVNFYLSDDGLTWAQLGTADRNAGAFTTSIVNGAAAFEIGNAFSGSGAGIVGEYYACQIRNGINGTPVLDWDLTRDGRSGTALATSTGQTLTASAGVTFGFD